jgi:hypothetical protein
MELMEAALRSILQELFPAQAGSCAAGVGAAALSSCVQPFGQAVYRRTGSTARVFVLPVPQVLKKFVVSFDGL